ncbi:MAG: hypothetical protein ACLPID_20120 [Beijerinckiaceae bacterium]
MMRRFLVFAVLLAAPVPGVEAKDLELAKGYAIAFATAAYASGHCGGMDVNENELLVLKNAAGLTDDDDAWLAQEINHAKPTIENAFHNEGAGEWCSKAWTLFGPQSIGIIQK